MLWPLLRGIIFIAIVAALALGVIFLLDLDSAAYITVAGREFTITTAFGDHPGSCGLFGRLADDPCDRGSCGRAFGS